LAVFDQDADNVIAIDEALERLERESPLHAEVVKLRYFAGLSREEIAAVMRISVFTVDKYWRLARNWLHRELS